MDPMVLAQVLRQLPIPDDPNLLVGHSSADDAAVYRLTDDLAVIQTLDFFTPMVDDPYQFGQIAAANSLSDVYAMGGKPVLALNIAAFPDCLDPEVLGEILRGSSAKVREAGANTVGGHTISDDEPKFGLSVMGLVHPAKVWANTGARPGDFIYLTKKIGTGILNTAMKVDLLAADVVVEVIRIMSELNAQAASAAQAVGISAATDITGFGLLGHAMEMAQGSGLDMEIQSDRVPCISATKEMAEMGLIPAGAYRNRGYIADHCVGLEHVIRWKADAMVDPQTSGGLLLSVPEAKAASLEHELQERGVFAALIGQMLSSTEGNIILR